MKIEECFKEGLLRKIRPSTDKANKSLKVSEEYI